MAVNILDQRTALIVIDLQKGFLGYPTTHPISEIVERASTLAGAFRRCGLPVVLVNVDGRPPGRTEQASRLGTPPAGWTELLPELNQQPEDWTVTKKTAGAFTHTGLEERLRTVGMTQVVVSGIATSMGVEATARSAYELGFNVMLAVDAMTDTNPETHLNSITRIFPRIGETGTTREIIDLLESSREGRRD